MITHVDMNLAQEASTEKKRSWKCNSSQGQCHQMDVKGERTSPTREIRDAGKTDIQGLNVE